MQLFTTALLKTLSFEAFGLPSVGLEKKEDLKCLNFEGFWHIRIFSPYPTMLPLLQMTSEIKLFRSAFSLKIIYIVISLFGCLQPLF